jgi:hypothetical protein
LLGAADTSQIALGDTKPFVLDTEPARIIDLLNATVRAHGQLTWVFEHTPHADKPQFPFMMTFMTRTSGFGLGVPGGPPAALVDISRYMTGPAKSGAVLDRVIGPDRNGLPLVIQATFRCSVADMAAAVGVPVGIEVAPKQSSRTVAASTHIVATGRTLREVLDLISALDPDYGWREMDGVVVIRPITAWNDPVNPLFETVEDVQLADVPTFQAASVVASALGAGPTFGSFQDSRRLSLSLFRPTALELLNALVRAHGELYWSFEDAERTEIEQTGLRHRLTLHLPGGTGVGVLVR